MGFVDGCESGTAGVIENPEGWACRNDKGDDADGLNDSRGSQEDDTELGRWGWCVIQQGKQPLQLGTALPHPLQVAGLADCVHCYKLFFLHT